ncbi:MAG: shikimate dehydrogenase family protein, partial [Candidatus Cryptobacteroides sp.]
MENKRFGLIGHPIAHSLSPLLFNAGYGGEFIYELIEGEDFDASWNEFIKSYDGINVTTPFKEKAWAKADILSDECRLIGASNLIVKTSEGTKAFNSDYLGVRKWLAEVVPSMGQVSDASQESISVAVIGCGGAGKAAAAASSLMGFRTILVNRDMTKAQAIVDNYNRFASSCPGVAPALLEIVPITDV